MSEIGGTSPSEINLTEPNLPQCPGFDMKLSLPTSKTDVHTSIIPLNPNLEPIPIHSPASSEEQGGSLDHSLLPSNLSISVLNDDLEAGESSDLGQISETYKSLDLSQKSSTEQTDKVSDLSLGYMANSPALAQDDLSDFTGATFDAVNGFNETDDFDDFAQANTEAIVIQEGFNGNYQKSDSYFFGQENVSGNKELYTGEIFDVLTMFEDEYHEQDELQEINKDLLLSDIPPNGDLNSHMTRPYGGPRCYDLWQGLAFNDDINDTQLNNRNRLRWKQSQMRRHCLLAMGIPFNLDEGKSRAPAPSLDNMASNGGYELKDIESIAKRLDTTMAQSLCTVGQELLSEYPVVDLNTFHDQIHQVLEEVSLSIEYWRTQIKSVEESQDTYQKIIANLVSHTHKIRPSVIAKSTRASRSNSANRR